MPICAVHRAHLPPNGVVADDIALFRRWFGPAATRTGRGRDEQAKSPQAAALPVSAPSMPQPNMVSRSKWSDCQRPSPASSSCRDAGWLNVLSHGRHASGGKVHATPASSERTGRPATLSFTWVFRRSLFTAGRSSSRKPASKPRRKPRGAGAFQKKSAISICYCGTSSFTRLALGPRGWSIRRPVSGTKSPCLRRHLP